MDRFFYHLFDAIGDISIALWAVVRFALFWLVFPYLIFRLGCYNTDGIPNQAQGLFFTVVYFVTYLGYKSEHDRKLREKEMEAFRNSNKAL